MSHQNDAPTAAGVFDPEPGDLRSAKPGRIGGRQRGPALQARHDFEKLHDLIGAEHDRPLAWFSHVGDALGDIRLAECDAEEEPQGANGLVQPRPGNPRRYEMDLKSVDVVQRQSTWQTAEIPTELRNRADVRSLHRR